MQQFRIQLLGKTVSIKRLPFPEGDSHEFFVDPHRPTDTTLALLSDWHGVDIGNADDHPEQLHLYMQFQNILIDEVAFIIHVDEALMIRGIDPA